MNISLELHEDGFVIVRCETDSDELFAFEERTFHECWLFQHRCNCLAFAHVCAVDLGYLSPGQAAPIEQLLPAHALGPSLHGLDINSVVAQIVELILVGLSFQPFPGLAAGVATFDSVQC